MSGRMVREFADTLRARIVELLVGEQLCTCHLVDMTGARQTNISICGCCVTLAWW